MEENLVMYLPRFYLFIYLFIIFDISTAYFVVYLNSFAIWIE